MLQVARLAPTLLQSSRELVGGFFRERYESGRRVHGSRRPPRPLLHRLRARGPRGPAGADRRGPHPRLSDRVRGRRGAGLRPSELPGPLLGQPARGRAAGRRAAAHARSHRHLPRRRRRLRDRSGRRRGLRLRGLRRARRLPGSARAGAGQRRADGAAADAGGGGRRPEQLPGRARRPHHGHRGGGRGAAPVRQAGAGTFAPWLLSQAHPQGGFRALPGRPSPICCPRPPRSTRWSGCTRTSRR